MKLQQLERTGCGYHLINGLMSLFKRNIPITEPNVIGIMNGVCPSSQAPVFIRLES